MPELPEVETVCRGLNIILGRKPKIEKIYLKSLGLRQPFIKKNIAKAHGQKINKIHRRAKYLIFELEKDCLVSHLGMTGSWRLREDKRKHDHVEIHLSSNEVLVYRDPRRFGQFDLLSKNGWEKDRRFLNLGPEPLDSKSFNADYLFEKINRSSVKIKSLIMDQKIVVGVGNIYASEALFLCGVAPFLPGSKMKHNTCKGLVESIQVILADAIECGGTTISDFRQAGGAEGYFQNHLYVYGRANEPCVFCDSPIKSQVIAGRNSFWCPACQSSSIIKSSAKRTKSAKGSRKKTSRISRS